jgi:hypothetical protein
VLKFLTGLNNFILNSVHDGNLKPNSVISVYMHYYT